MQMSQAVWINSKHFVKSVLVLSRHSTFTNITRHPGFDELELTGKQDFSCWLNDGVRELFKDSCLAFYLPFLYLTCYINRYSIKYMDNGMSASAEPLALVTVNSIHFQFLAIFIVDT